MFDLGSGMCITNFYAALSNDNSLPAFHHFMPPFTISSNVKDG
jgi:hypothetical protein